MLVSAYERLRGKKKLPFEILIASCDEDEEAFDKYRKKLPWPALPFGSPVLEMLSAEYGADGGIPKLVLLSVPSGEPISDDGVLLLRRHERAFPWSVPEKPPETPHWHMLGERLLRKDPVDAGARKELPRYKEIDMLALPERVTSHASLVEAVRQCDWLCTALAVQAHSVHNTRFLKLSLIEYTFAQLLPVPVPVDRPGEAACLWRSPMKYEEQRTMLEVLSRIAEHFAATALSLNHTRSLDAVRMVVPACIAAAADCVMRQTATNKPSELCLHLAGISTTDAFLGMEAHEGFALDAGALAAQSALVACNTLELNIARTHVLDYFGSMRALPKIFQWDRSKKISVGLARWLRYVCADRAFPADGDSILSYVVGHDDLLIKNYPEFRHYRDIAFWFKFFLNPDKDAFPEFDRETEQRKMILSFHLDGEPGEINTRYGMYDGGGGRQRDQRAASQAAQPPHAHLPLRLPRAADAVCAAVDDRK